LQSPFKEGRQQQHRAAAIFDPLPSMARTLLAALAACAVFLCAAPHARAADTSRDPPPPNTAVPVHQDGVCTMFDNCGRVSRNGLFTTLPCPTNRTAVVR
jgi:hypothetical protein